MTGQRSGDGRHRDSDHGRGVHGVSEDVRRLAWAEPATRITVDFRNLPKEPRNPAAESALLGALMLSKRCLDELLPVLRTEHFTSRRHQDIFHAIRELHRTARPVDPVLVNDELRRRGISGWGHVSAPLVVHACLEATYFPGHGDSYATIVLDNALRRRIVQAGVRIAQFAASGLGDGGDLLEKAKAELAISTPSVIGAERPGLTVLRDVNVARSIAPHGEDQSRQ